MKKIILTFFLVFVFMLLKAQEDSTRILTDTTYSDTGEPGNNSTEESEEVTHAAIDPDVLGNTEAYKEEQIKVRKFDQAKWKKVVGTANYEEKPERKFDGINASPWVSELLQIVVYAVIIGFVVFLIYYIIKSIATSNKIAKKDVVRSVSNTVSVENIEDLDIKQLLERALANSDLRLAVRLYYLGLLKNLNENGMIIWKKDKTNRDYLTELFSRNHHFEEVRKLTLAYEQVWYGEHALTQASFESVVADFDLLNQNLNSQKEQ